MLSPTQPVTARNRLPLTSYGVTDVGRKREHNEDAFKISVEHELFVLADGMGGHASGEVASNLTVNHVVEFFTRGCRVPDFVWPYSTPGLRTFEERAVSNSIQFANDRVFVESMKDRRYDGMGTTICVLAGAGEHLVLGHVGDSRIYRFRSGKLEQLTEDHSLINLYRRTRNVSEEELQAFGKKNVIVRAVGLKDYVEPDLQVVDRVPGDIFLMCSDGLSEMVDDWIIREVIMGDSDNLEEIGKTLVRLANQNGGKDNITVVLVRVAEQPLGGPETYPTDVSLARSALIPATLSPEERAITEITAMPPLPPPPPAPPSQPKELDPFVPLMLSPEAIAEITGQRGQTRPRPNEGRSESRDVLRRTAPASPMARVGASRVGVELISGEVTFDPPALPPQPGSPDGQPPNPAPATSGGSGASQRRALLRDTRPLMEESRTAREQLPQSSPSTKTTSSPTYTPPGPPPAAATTGPTAQSKPQSDPSASDGFQSLRDELNDSADEPFPIEDPDLRAILRNSKVAPLPPLPRR